MKTADVFCALLFIFLCMAIFSLAGNAIDKELQIKETSAAAHIHKMSPDVREAIQQK